MYIYIYRYNKHFFNLLLCLYWHPLALFCRFKGIILMLQNLTEGETDESYEKTINLRELKSFFKRLSRIISYRFCMHREKWTADMSVKSFQFTAAVRGFTFIEIFGHLMSMKRENLAWAWKCLWLICNQVHKREYDCWASS